MIANNALRVRMNAAYQRLYTSNVAEAYNDYHAYLNGEVGNGNPAPMSRHTIHHLPAVMHIRFFNLLDVTSVELEAWITWADVLTGRYHRELKPGDVGTDIYDTPAWREPMAHRRDQRKAGNHA